LLGGAARNQAAYFAYALLEPFRIAQPEAVVLNFKNVSEEEIF